MTIYYDFGFINIESTYIENRLIQENIQYI